MIFLFILIGAAVNIEVALKAGLAGLVIIIIGLISSIVFINSNVVNSFERNTSSLKNLFQFLSEESMLSGSIIGWHSSNNQSIAYYLDNSGKRANDKKIKIPKSNWNNWAPYKKIFITSLF